MSDTALVIASIRALERFWVAKPGDVVQLTSDCRLLINGVRPSLSGTIYPNCDTVTALSEFASWAARNVQAGRCTHVQAECILIEVKK